LATYSDPSSVLRGAPGPSPWYLRADPPKIDAVTWEEYEEDGGTVLLKRANDVLAVIGMYCYLLTLDSDTLLVWYQQHDNEFRDFIDFEVLNLERLKPISDVSLAVHRLKSKKNYIFTEDTLLTRFRLSVNSAELKNHYEFPEEFQSLDELLILAHQTGQPREVIASSLCLFVLRPRSREYEIYPQDWFNDGSLDYGYQWVTRVAREPHTKKIYGEGFRISRFVLDPGLRNIERLFDEETP